MRTFESVSLVLKFEPRERDEPEMEFEPEIVPTKVVAETVEAVTVFEPLIVP